MEEKKEIIKLKRKNLYKNIIIILLTIALLIVTTPKIKKVVKKAINKQISISEYNSKYKLNLESAYGDIEAYHPKILYFKEKWNGYYYWMCFTPYPDSDSSKENPHIVVSNDMINWKEPEGFQNSLDEVENQNNNKYNSDTHLVMNTELNRLECYWRYVNDDKNEVTVYRRFTIDGVNWSEKEAVIYSDDRQNKDYVSPAIIFEDGIYKIWYVDKQNTVMYAESKDGTNWKDVKKINLNYPKELKSWHLDVIKTEEGYEMLMMAYTSVAERGNASLYYTVSKDNEDWSKECIEIIKPTSKSEYWDNRGIYRSSMIKKDGIYYVFYSASNKKNIKGTGIMYGKDISNLHKVDIDYINDEKAVQKFEKLIDKEK